MRIDPSKTGSEVELLLSFLDFQRETVLLKTDDLTKSQFAECHPPSSMTLAGIVYHLVLVEDGWIETRFLGMPAREPFASVDWKSDPDWEFRMANDLDPDELRAMYRETGMRTNEIVKRATDLDQLSVNALRDGEHFSLRWVLLHLIEETARHAGHADLLREAIDGSVGE